MRVLRFPDELKRFGPKEGADEEVVNEEVADGGASEEATDGDDL